MAEELSKSEQRKSAADAAAAKVKARTAASAASPAASPAVVVAVPANHCLVCEKAVYLVEQIDVDGLKFHKACV
jgi:hypothetical protein